MKYNFKKSSYGSNILIGFLCIIVLLLSTAAFYFEPDIIFTFACQALVLLLVIILVISSIISKKKYNYACKTFADYIVNNRKKEEGRTQKDVELAEQIKNLQESSVKGREDAIAEAFARGKNEGISQATQMIQEFNSFTPQVPENLSSDEEALYNEAGEVVLIRRKVKKGEYLSHSFETEEDNSPDVLPLPSGASFDADDAV